MLNKASKYPINLAFLYGYNFSGHKIAAEALADFFPKEIVKVHFLNLSQIYPNIGNFVAKTYFKLIEKTPSLWNYVYDKPLMFNSNETLKYLIPKFSISDLKETLLNLNISSLVYTHSLSSLLASEKTLGLKEIKRFSIITDICPNSFWDKNCLSYFVPTLYSLKKLEERKIPQDKIFSYGMPLRKEFFSFTKKEIAQKKLGLNPNIPTFLLTGGNHGLISFEEILTSFINLNKKVQLIVFSGSNKKIKNKLSTFKNNNVSILLCDYLKDPSLYYFACDCVLGKPGGLTIFETASAKKPFIIYSSSPGQEEKNLNYLKRTHSCLYAKNFSQLNSILKMFFTNRNQFKITQNNLERLHKNNSSLNIVNEILKKII